MRSRNVIDSKYFNLLQLGMNPDEYGITAATLIVLGSKKDEYTKHPQVTMTTKYYYLFVSPFAPQSIETYNKTIMK